MKNKISWIVSGIFVLAQAAAANVFVDNFNNGVVADSDNIVDFWDSSGVGGGGLGGANESGGELVITAGRTGGTSNADWVVASEPQSMFNFVAGQGLSFQAIAPSGSAMVEQTDFTDPDSARLRFSVTQEQQESIVMDDAFELYIESSQSGMLRFRENGDSWNELATFSSTTDIVSFRLDLTATGFGLELFDSNGSVFSDTGTYNINQSAWANGSAVAFTAQDRGSPEGAQVTVSLDQFTVAQIPEPMSSGLIILSSALVWVLFRRIRASK